MIQSNHWIFVTFFEVSNQKTQEVKTSCVTL